MPDKNQTPNQLNSYRKQYEQSYQQKINLNYSNDIYSGEEEQIQEGNEIEINQDFDQQQNNLDYSNIESNRNFLISNSTLEQKKVQQNNFNEKKGIEPSVKIINFQLQFFYKLLNNIPTFKPISTSRFIWDLIIILILALYFLIIPLVIAFDKDFVEFIKFDFLHSLLIGFLLFDILVNGNTAVFNKGVIVLEKREIVYRYFQDGMISDLLGLASIITYKIKPIEWEYYNFLQILFFLKMYNFSRIYQRIEMRFRLGPKISNVFNLVNLIIIVLYICHLFACLWLWISRQQQKIGVETWVNVLGITEQSWDIQFLYSYYFMVVTMVTVGFGDMSPVNHLEVLVCIVTMLIACVVFAFVMNEIGQILQKLKQAQEEIERNTWAISQWMQKKNVDQDLQFQVREYLSYYWKEENTEDVERQVLVMNQLSKKLKSSLLKDANKIVISECPIFKDNFSEESIQQTIPLIKEIVYLPEEIIFHKNDLENDPAIYFIEKGRVELFAHIEGIDKMDLNIKILEPGQFFGQIGFFTEQEREISAKALDFTTILKINRNDFLYMIQNNPVDYEKFCYIKDRVLFSKNLGIINDKCLSCNKSDHTIRDCNMLHFFTQKNVLFIKNSFTKNQDRQRYYRKRPIESLDALSNIFIIQDSVLGILVDNPDLMKEEQNFDSDFTVYDSDSFENDEIFQSTNINNNSFQKQQQQQMQKSFFQQLNQQKNINEVQSQNNQISEIKNQGLFQSFNSPGLSKINNLKNIEVISEELGNSIDKNIEQSLEVNPIQHQNIINNAKNQSNSQNTLNQQNKPKIDLNFKALNNQSGSNYNQNNLKLSDTNLAISKSPKSLVNIFSNQNIKEQQRRKYSNYKPHNQSGKNMEREMEKSIRYEQISRKEQKYTTKLLQTQIEKKNTNLQKNDSFSDQIVPSLSFSPFNSNQNYEQQKKKKALSKLTQQLIQKQLQQQSPKQVNLEQSINVLSNLANLFREQRQKEPQQQQQKQIQKMHSSSINQINQKQRGVIQMQGSKLFNQFQPNQNFLNANNTQQNNQQQQQMIQSTLQQIYMQILDQQVQQKAKLSTKDQDINNYITLNNELIIDTCKNFDIYYPAHNIDQVIKNIVLYDKKRKYQQLQQNHQDQSSISSKAKLQNKFHKPALLGINSRFSVNSLNLQKLQVNLQKNKKNSLQSEGIKRKNESQVKFVSQENNSTNNY
ncbi:Cyclic nucleotide-binding protein [Pseudocohnilembus persalinus]|uniref:Cyclic nucleotide-binding protein n=1 Tax=Pseudocohnilembus persalinus TaxID=266149 RepID=A0A0V0QF08_PSEPJ|nr:Cyclic nucleotide-binding protein [Pseudocohnilembus persalinus]|eukprot:KRX00772.1 Cyclic nucleotide-binding protein [Pseudocohnilembus persalinus]